MAKQPKQGAEPLTLVGRCFHIFGDGGIVQYQGIVRGDLGEGYYLIQFFDWLVGEASTLQIRHIAELRPGQEAGCWQFYEDSQHMRFWHEHRAPKKGESGGVR